MEILQWNQIWNWDHVYEIGTTNAPWCRVPDARDHTIGPRPLKMVTIIPRRRRGTCKGVPVATWCSEWIFRMRGGLVHHKIKIAAALSLPLLPSAAVGHAPTIFQNGWFCTRISNFFQTPIFLIASSRPRMEKLHSCWPRTAWCVLNMFHKNGMRPLIIPYGTICYIILYGNSPILYIKLKYMYSVISAKLHWLPGSSKKWTIDQFVAFGVRFFYPWAGSHRTVDFWNSIPLTPGLAPGCQRHQLLGPFEEGEEGIGIASDVVEAKSEDPATARLWSEVCWHEETTGP